MKKAKVVIKQGRLIPDGYEARMCLHAGKKGTGKLLGEVIYWPWSAISYDQASEIIEQIAAKHGVDVVWDTLADWE